MNKNRQPKRLFTKMEQGLPLYPNQLKKMEQYTRVVICVGLMLMVGTGIIAQNVNFTISVTGFKKASGKIQIALYNDQNGFLTPERVYKNIVLDVNKSILRHTVQLPKGQYAVALYHDGNSNGICDKNVFGIPVERYGFSNNIRPILRAPSFESTVIDVRKDVEIEIALLK